MSNELSINVHDIIKKYSLPISHRNQSIKDCLKNCYDGFYQNLEEAVAKDYPDDFPFDFYNKLKNRNLSIIYRECSIILDILEIDDQDSQSEKFNELMQFIVKKRAFRENKYSKGSLMTRIRPEIGSYERKNLFHIPYTFREKASSQRFSIPGSPCLYLSVYGGLIPHNHEMVKSAWIECGMPGKFTYCIYELQKDIIVLHFGKSGQEYLSEYDHAKDENRKKDRLKAITEYLLSFPLRAACHISVENKLAQGGASNHEEYLFPQLLMQWLQKYSIFVGVSYQGASSCPMQRDLDIVNLAIPARNITAENEYDPDLKKCFKLSEPQTEDLLYYFNSNKMKRKIENVKRYSDKLEEIMNVQSIPSNHPYTNLSSYCHNLYQIYSQISKDNISTSFENFISLYGKVQTIDTEISNCKTAEEWVSQYNNKPLAETDFENILIPFQNIVIPVYEEINRIFYLQDCSSFLKELNFQYI